ncbi:MAG: PCYCGC motif-containing (lipo)protein [Candidatus Rokuibacteriota bacterium]
MNRRSFLYGGATVLAAGGTVGIVLAGRSASSAPVTIDGIGDKVQTLPRGQLPEFASTPDQQTLYRYAVEHGDELRYIPCMCGCGTFGHTSNRDCYIKADNADGTLTFTSHAAT